MAFFLHGLCHLFGFAGFSRSAEHIHCRGLPDRRFLFHHVRWDILYRTIKNGLFVGEQEILYYYPFPSYEDLEGKYYSWWHLAMDSGMGLR